MLNSSGTTVVPVVKRDLFIDPCAREVLVNPEFLTLIHGETSNFERVSPFHDRSVVDMGRLCIKDTDIFDENGDYYGAFNI